MITLKLYYIYNYEDMARFFVTFKQQLDKCVMRFSDPGCWGYISLCPDCMLLGIKSPLGMYFFAFHNYLHD